jgi:hypothetical protein
MPQAANAGSITDALEIIASREGNKSIFPHMFHRL